MPRASRVSKYDVRWGEVAKLGLGELPDYRETTPQCKLCKIFGVTKYRYVLLSNFNYMYRPRYFQKVILSMK